MNNLRYNIFDTLISPSAPFGKMLTTEESLEIFKKIFNDGETAGHDSTSMDSSWEETLKDL